jgi:hypothetical protein
MPRRVLEAEISAELAFGFVDRQVALTVQRQLIGALLQDAAQGLGKAHSYDRSWMRSITGYDFLATLPLEQSAAHACDKQVASRLPHGFSVDEYAPRTRTIRMLEEFLHSPASIFILTGRSGTGKSWVLAHWAFEVTSGHARLLIPGDLFTEHSSLASLIANELRKLTSLVADDQTLLQKVARPALSAEFGPFVVVLDDVRPFYSNPAKFARAVAALVDDAKKHRIKLVLSCQLDILRNLKPFSYLRPADIFQPEAPTSLLQADSLDPVASCVLDAFTDGELREAVSRRVEAGRAEKVFPRLRDPAFALLRNPYALNIFFTKATYAPPEAWDAVPSEGVFSLLDRRITSLLNAASTICNLETSEVRQVLLYVTELLWKHSDAGMSRADLYKEITSQFADIGKRALDALFPSGVLLFDTRVQFSELQIGARLYAHTLQKHYEDQTLLFSQLRVERDHDVVVHLVTLVQDPVKLATHMTEIDTRWIPALSEGLSYCNPPDQRIHAALLALARRKRSNWNVTDALGRFSLRSRPAWKELVRQFLSPDAEDRYLVERALWSVAKFYPERVAPAIRLRYRIRKSLEQDQKREPVIRHDLARALTAMTGIDSEYAAKRVLKLVNVVGSFATRGIGLRSDEERLRFVIRDSLLAAYDKVRVLAYAYADEDAFKQFLSDLQSPDVVTRARAGNALELIGRMLPERVQSYVCEALHKEQVPKLLARILWASPRLAEQVPEMILEAIESNGAAFWKEYESAAAALASLELLTRRHPQRVLALLPSAWDDWPEETRLLLQELIVFCQFRCHQVIGRVAAVGPPTHLQEPADSPIQEPYRLYQLRAEIVSGLLECGSEIGVSDSPLIRRFGLQENGLDFFMVDISAWMRGNEKSFSSHPRADGIMHTAIQAVNIAARHSADVLDRWRTNVRFLLVRDCLEVLIALLSRRSDPESWVRELPHDWEILYVARHLLEIGCRNEGLLTLAQGECESHRMSATAQASSERNECLIVLQKIVPELVPNVEKEKQGVAWFLSGGRSTGAQLAAQMDEVSVNVLECLEEAIARPTDTILLERWNIEATCWSTILLSRAYSRMFLFRRLLRYDVVQLTDSMLLALEAVPHSPAQQEHIALYRVIRERLDGKVVTPPSIRNVSMPIVQSHQLAAELLVRPAGGIARADLRRVFLDRRGWWEDENYRWDDDGTIQHGWGVSYHLVVFFPAVRLALWALGRESNWWDPAFSWMEERRRAMLLSKQLAPHSRDRWSEIRQIEATLREFPDQEMLHAAHGLLLLMEGEANQAQSSLEKALASPLCTGSERGRVLYNLACVCARKGEENECRSRLLEAKQYGGCDVEWMQKDPDLQTVTERTWFQELLTELSNKS